MKKKECIVHIGMHKTGSSSIQKTLGKLLESENFYYFNLGAYNYGRRIKSFFLKEKLFSFHERRGLIKIEIKILIWKQKLCFWKI